jgi:hypothetical protein
MDKLRFGAKLTMFFLVIALLAYGSAALAPQPSEDGSDSQQFAAVGE